MITRIPDLQADCRAAYRRLQESSYRTLQAYVLLGMLKTDDRIDEKMIEMSFLISLPGWAIVDLGNLLYQPVWLCFNLCLCIVVALHGCFTCLLFCIHLYCLCLNKTNTHTHTHTHTH